jgi:hypothetical protein
VSARRPGRGGGRWSGRGAGSGGGGDVGERAVRPDRAGRRTVDLAERVAHPGPLDVGALAVGQVGVGDPRAVAEGGGDPSHHRRAAQDGQGDGVDLPLGRPRPEGAGPADLAVRLVGDHLQRRVVGPGVADRGDVDGDVARGREPRVTGQDALPRPHRERVGVDPVRHGPAAGVDVAVDDEAVGPVGHLPARLGRPGEGVEGLEAGLPDPLLHPGPRGEDRDAAGRQHQLRDHGAVHHGVGRPPAVDQALDAGVGVVDVVPAAAPGEGRGGEPGHVGGLLERRGGSDVVGQLGVPAVEERGGQLAEGPGLRLLARLVGPVLGVVGLRRERGAAAQRAGHAHQPGDHVVGGVRAVRGERLAVALPVLVLAVGHGVAGVVAGVAEPHRQRVAQLGRQLLLGEVALDERRVAGLGLRLQHVVGAVPPAGVVVDLRHHPLVGGVADGQLLAGLARVLARPAVALAAAGRAVVVAVEDVALRRVRAALEVEHEVDLRLAGARRQQHLAEAHHLQLDAGVLLDGAEGARRVAVRERQPAALRFSYSGACTPVPARWQSGAVGAPGSPSTVPCVRQLPTDGYGCDSGPGTNVVSMPTSTSVPKGTEPPPDPISRQAAMTSSARRRAPRSACA